MQQQPPPVLMWFKIYSAAMAVLYVFVVLLGLFFAFAPADWLELRQGEAFFYAVICVVIGLPFIGAFAAALFLPPKPWVWIYDLVLIAIGFGSCCILPASVALLVFWIKPETKAHFHRV